MIHPAIARAPVAVDLYDVGTINNPEGLSILFCNGINNDAEQAQESGRMISQACGGRKVTVFHNMTSLLQYTGIGVERIETDTIRLSLYNEEGLRQIKVAKLFAEHISHLIRTYELNDIPLENIRICLFLHSHGTVIGDMALSRLTEREKAHVTVYTYGGARFIKNTQAHCVRNYVNQGDRISDFGKIRSMKGFNPTIIKMMKQVQEYPERKDRIIFEQSLEDTQQDASAKWNVGPKANWERYQRICQFQGTKQEYIGILFQDPFFTQQVRQYKAILNDYSVTFLPGPVQQQTTDPETTNQGFLDRVYQTATVAYHSAAHVFNSHSFIAYRDQVGRDVEEIPRL